MKLTFIKSFAFLLALGACQAFEGEEAQVVAEEVQVVAEETQDVPKEAQVEDKCESHDYCTQLGQVPAQHHTPDFSSIGCSHITGSYEEDPKTTQCCHTWNLCTHICGTTRSFCDSKFNSCVEDKCMFASEGPDKAECLTDVTALKEALAVHDCDLFEEGQDHACVCVDEDRVHRQRYNTIHNFFDKYDINRMHTLHTTYNKTHTHEEFNEALMDLYMQYPEKKTIFHHDHKGMHVKRSNKKTIIDTIAEKEAAEKAAIKEIEDGNAQLLADRESMKKSPHYKAEDDTPAQPNVSLEGVIDPVYLLLHPKLSEMSM